FFPPQVGTWISHSSPELEVFIPFLGKYQRPFSRRCCQRCTPSSWVRSAAGGDPRDPQTPGDSPPFLSCQDEFYPEDLAPLGFRDVSRVTETDTR
ncbi:GPAT2 acyltransferase, partial [Regulus satrapa]|nr:GPAT2 acyltransferase [Regulus satrapa]